MTPAIVLAAGASSRMGRPKALLDAGNRTFIRRILDTLRAGGVAGGRRGGSRRPGRGCRGGRGVRLRADGPQPARGRRAVVLSDRRAGRRRPRRTSTRVLVTLVDVPLIGPEAVRLLLASAPRPPRRCSARSTRAATVIPSSSSGRFSRRCAAPIQRRARKRSSARSGSRTSRPATPASSKTWTRQRSTRGCSDTRGPLTLVPEPVIRERRPTPMREIPRCATPTMVMPRPLTIIV